MSFGGTESWLRILLITMPVSALMMRAGMVWRWTRRRRHTPDSDKLAIGLRAELTAMLELYETNLRLIADDAGYLISAKSLPQVYRTNLGRLPTLDSAAIPLVVAAYCRNARIEGLLSVRADLARQRSPQPEGPPRDMIQREYLAGCDEVGAAIAALTPPATPAAAPAAAPEIAHTVVPLRSR